ncbi:putative non-specific protein-tyrosine kinase TKL-Pl-7 family [Helianthus annuus]|uniref:Non-specific protein-tyrosine kinase TKL-Pl-7 family n=1 Tax=Helianthus annuus TaxID=4232 RepID=A0A251S3D8_HELAN|nr:putative non-specific protein-tyrosine kinase TKL-Pl-7 family [Helianthus annuus]KAJ0462238.1 putative non-specific protein-tyrosine kinase TKL-Pl-7 family [Helianthus annuus]KAJ0837920.1 putative non-specific protein-tyrosine kinase TKL-Pl-7 family [Helianthus annuus]
MIHIDCDRIMVKNKRIQMKEIIRIAADVAEGIKFMNDHGVAYKDLNTKWILFDKNGTLCLGDIGIVAACKNVVKLWNTKPMVTVGLLTRSSRVIQKQSTETWMSNVFSFGMMVWEMMKGEAAYATLPPTHLILATLIGLLIL